MKRCNYGVDHFEDDEGDFFQLNLGWGFVAEHEWGIDRLKTKFGIDDSKPGIEGRTISQVPDELIFEDGEGVTHLAYLGVLVSPEDLERTLRRYLEEDMATAWSEGQFGIAAWSDENREHLRELHAAFERKDIAIWIGGQDGPYPYSNGGLQLTIVSKLPEKYAEMLRQADLKPTESR